MCTWADPQSNACANSKTKKKQNTALSHGCVSYTPLPSHIRALSTTICLQDVSGVSICIAKKLNRTINIIMFKIDLISVTVKHKNMK